MRKIETIWHQILFQAVKKNKFKFTQQELAKQFGYSLSTVNYALDIPAKIGAIRKTGKFSVLADYKKLLFYWANQRHLSKDIIYQTHSPYPVQEREGLIPPKMIFAGYSAAKKHLNEPPSEYNKIYFYASPTQIKQIKKRFPEKKGEANTFALKKISTLDNYGKYTTLPQTYVDIWNFTDWYARDYAIALEEKINGLLS